MKLWCHSCIVVVRLYKELMSNLVHVIKGGDLRNWKQNKTSRYHTYVCYKCFHARIKFFLELLQMCLCFLVNINATHLAFHFHYNNSLSSFCYCFSIMILIQYLNESTLFQTLKTLETRSSENFIHTCTLWGKRPISTLTLFLVFKNFLQIYWND